MISRFKRMACLMALAIMAYGAAGLAPALLNVERSHTRFVQTAHAETGNATRQKNAPSARARRRALLARVKNWGYQLRFVDADDVKHSPYDLMIIDHAISYNKRFQRQISRAEIETMKQRPDGSRRLVLSYLSIGEAERYRFYWRQDWYKPALAPPWLGKMNLQWEGNYLVRFWHPAWQNIIYGRVDGGSYIERIIAQGFDGIYLDRADVYEELGQDHRRPKRQMIKFISRLAKAARRHHPEFLVIMQNAEELVQSRKLRRAIDGLAKEDLFFGVDGDDKPNSKDDISWSLKQLRFARKKGLKIFAVEYLHDQKIASQTMQRLAAERFIPYTAPRGLGSLWFRGRDF